MNYDLALVLANYNDSRYLINWVDKVYQGSMLPDEIIIVDDCSTDRSVELLKLLQTRHKEIRLVVNERNKNPNGASVEGIRVAKSRFVGCWACDDEVGFDYVRQMKRAIENFPLVDVYLCNAIVEREGKGYKKVFLPFDSYLSPDYLVKVYSRGYPAVINIVGSVVNKDVVLTCWDKGGASLNTCFDDMYLFFSMFDKGAMLLGDCLIKYRASFCGYGARGSYKNDKAARQTIMDMYSSYPKIKERAEKSGVWNNDFLIKCHLGLWVTQRMPKWMRRKIYERYYEGNG